MNNELTGMVLISVATHCLFDIPLWTKETYLFSTFTHKYESTN